MKKLVVLAAFSALAACNGSDQDERISPEMDEARQQATVEQAIRNAYQNEGAEVTEIEMQRTPDGTHYVGTATVRNEDGNEINVDCSVSANRTGEPEIECIRSLEDEDNAVAAS